LEILYIPLAVSIGCFLTRGKTARNLTLYGSVLQVALTVYMLTQFKADGSYNFLFKKEWIPQAGITLKFGIDGISMLMVILTNLLLPLILLANYNRPIDRPHLFYGLISFMHFALLGVFISLDGILFYTFWELALIPIYFICALWGGTDKNRITLKFFIYTFFGSLFMLASLIVMKSFAGSFDIDIMYAATLTQKAAVYVLIGFFLAFAIKMPVFPFHTWQPDTYEQSPTPVTIILSALMVKMGIYAVLRWLMPVMPEATAYWSDTVIILSIIGIVYASCLAMVQTDIKRLVAYSSIAHMGLMCAAAFSQTPTGMHGLMVQMFNHGINIIGLWIIVEVIQNRLGIKNLDQMGGMAQKAPRMAIFLVIISLANIGLPLTNGFIGEFLMFSGLFQYNHWFMAFAGLGIILSAVYTLGMIQKVIFGEGNELTATTTDLQPGETLALSLVVIMIIVLGVYPKPMLDLVSGTSEVVSKLF